MHLPNCLPCLLSASITVTPLPQLERVYGTPYAYPEPRLLISKLGVPSFPPSLLLLLAMSAMSASDEDLGVAKTYILVDKPGSSTFCSNRRAVIFYPLEGFSPYINADGSVNSLYSAHV